MDVPCGTCSGVGMVQRPESVNVKVPPGIAMGQKLRVAGMGEIPPGGRPGDLLVSIRVVDSPLYRRDGFDTHSEVLLPFTRLVLGGSIPVKTIHGESKIKVPPGTKAGSVLRLSKKGIPKLNEPGVGDHYVHVGVIIPQDLSDEQRNLLERLDSTLG